MTAITEAKCEKTARGETVIYLPPDEKANKPVLVDFFIVFDKVTVTCTSLKDALRIRDALKENLFTGLNIYQ